MLVAVPGTLDVVAEGEIKGGIIFGKSGLNVSIYYLDNSVARLGRFFDELVGDNVVIVE